MGVVFKKLSEVEKETTNDGINYLEDKNFIPVKEISGCVHLAFYKSC